MVTPLNVLLVSEDSWLTSLTEKLSAELGLHVVRRASVDSEFGRMQDVALAIVHDATGHDKEAVKNFIKIGVQSLRPAPVIVVTDKREPEVMIEYLRSGAADCVSSPVERNRMRFLFDSLTIEQRVAHQSTETQPAGQSGWVSQNGSEPVCASSSKLSNVIKKIEKVAPLNVNVLMTGESGVGKTRLSRMLHEISPRRSEPFVVVNCAAMPTLLLESMLFGHRRGAFTGADKHQDGKFAHVKGGTLLLDEVDTLSLEAQAKLLRTVESRVFEALGSNKSEFFRGRLIVATNQDLSAAVKAGKFRADLYYRLNVVELKIPPLRDRPEEILEIAEASIANFARDNQTTAIKMSPEVCDVLLNHPWPGNIRELKNAVEQAMTFATGDYIHLRDLPDSVLGIQRIDTGHGNEPPGPRPMSDVAAAPVPAPAPESLAGARALGEKQHLLEVLKECGNNRSQAAKKLGISRTALYKKISKYGLSRPSNL